MDETPLDQAARLVCKHASDAGLMLWPDELARLMLKASPGLGVSTEEAEAAVIRRLESIAGLTQTKSSTR